MLIQKLGKTKNNEEAAKCVYDWVVHIDKNVQLIYLSAQLEDTRKTLYNEVASYLITYEEEIKQAKNPLEKLQAIIKLVQNCELIHPFSRCEWPNILHAIH